MLSQRRADAIRDALVNTFKISSKRIQSLGLGEEQFVDPAHPASPVNEQIQIVTIAKQPEQSEQPAAQAHPRRPQKVGEKKIGHRLVPIVEPVSAFRRLRDRLRLPI